MENELVTVFLSHKLGKLIEDISSKKITTQEHLNLVWNKVFDEAIEIEKEQIIDAYERGDRYKFEISGEQYYNETYLK
jgi:hypothetical protein